MSPNKVVAVHQPNYLPWLGFFDKVSKADILILMDNVQYPKRSWTNRTRVRSQDGGAWLTVPVKVKGRYHQLISEVEILYEEDWVGQHLKTLERVYGRLPFYSEIYGHVETILTQRTTQLALLNTEIIRMVCSFLAVDVQFVSARDLSVSGKATDLLIGLTKAVGGTTYLSGEGGRDYQDDSRFKTAGLELCYQCFEHPEYDQNVGLFVPGLSIFDVVCNCGTSWASGFLCASKSKFFREADFFPTS